MRLHFRIRMLAAHRLLPAILRHVEGFRQVALLNSNVDCYPQYPRSGYHALLAVGAASDIRIANAGRAFQQIKEQLAACPDWWFGYFGYDLKNETEQLVSTHPDPLAFPVAGFFRPMAVLLFTDNEVQVSYLPEYLSEKEICRWFSQEAKELAASPYALPHLKPMVERETYISKVEAIQKLIARGDVYEMNFCMEFADANATINPIEVYQEINEHAAAPFSVFYRYDTHFLLSFSPERFLAKNTNELWSQPIKGTLAISPANSASDELLSQWRTNAKEVAENAMVTDLVRNDLSRVALPASVAVEEFCGVYTFSHVAQMISTIRCEVDACLSPVDIIRQVFPMGSMTGAPKISAMRIAEQFETHRRGLYSGAFGYFTPTGDFDFNVVIRSLLYNQQRSYLSYSVGSAITNASVPADEYEECMAKTYPVRRFITGH